MTGADAREVFEAILPDEALLELVQAAGFQQRQRKCDALHLIRTMIITAGSGQGGQQADVLKRYLEDGRESVARSSFYCWFSEPLERVMEGVRDRGLAYARALPRDLPGPLGRLVDDWHIVDSMTVRLPDALRDEYPGAGDYAALKVHKRFSVGVGTTVAYHLSPAREHDARHLTLDDSWRGLGLLVDLGYASFRLLQECEQYGVRYVLRLKESWKPKVQRIVRGAVSKAFVKDADFDMLIDEDVLNLDGRVIDLDVTLGQKAITSRLVGVFTPKGYCFFLTNLPRSVTAPSTVADLYRVRWEIELDNKLDKSCHRLDEIAARTGCAARAMVHASLVASMLACLLAYHHRRRAAPPPKPGAERTKPPIHPQSIARQLAVTERPTAWRHPSVRTAR